MKDYIIASDEHPWNPKTRIMQNTMLEVYPTGNTIRISDIQSMMPKQGYASQAIQQLKQLADKNSVKLELTAKAYANSPEYINDTEKLVKWYKKMGFQIDDEFVDDPEDLEGIEQVDMVYYPK
jgi:hypothetical protein